MTRAALERTRTIHHDLWSRAKRAVLAFIVALVLWTPAPALALNFTTSAATPSSAIGGWPVSSVHDANNGTVWSSNLHPTANNSEWLAYWWSEGMQNTNYVKILPRYFGNIALCFPVNFTIHYSNGSQWVQVASYTSYPRPSRGDWMILPLPGTYQANGILIVATTLGIDDVGNYAFQLAEATAGYDAGFNQFTFVHNDLPSLPWDNQIQGVGSNAFNPNKLSHWDYDDRGIVINPNGGTYRNIYAPQAVPQGGTFWNVYFGGWDGSNSQNDRVYLTTTADNFNSIGAHATMIDHGQYIHANNESVVKLASNDWRMVYTTYTNNGLNKPCYAFSTDGGSWTPNSGNSAYLLNMNGYASWATADVNGSNVIYRDNSGIWHLFFNDFNAWPGIYHATSSDFVNYTYEGAISRSAVIANDFKSFVYDGTRYYVGVYHNNTQYVWATVSTSISSPGPLTQTFTNQGSADQYIVAAGLVQDGSRIYGILYGAGAAPTLDQNRIFARWLQKKVVFQNNYVRWGDVETGFGPDNLRLYLAAGDYVETGNFFVYDTDGTTLLYTSPQVTMRAGDVWSYSGP
jgi:hypothetical protein